MRLQTTFAFSCALGPASPAGLFTIDGALVLSTANVLHKERTSQATAFWCSNNRTSHLGPSTTLERLHRVARIITRHNARVLDESIEVTILDGVCLKCCTVDQYKVAHDFDGAHVLVHDPVDALLAFQHVAVILFVELGLLVVLLIQLGTVASEVGASLAQEHMEADLGYHQHFNLRVEAILELFKRQLVLHHLLCELIHLVLELAPHERRLVMEQTAIWNFLCARSDWSSATAYDRGDGGSNGFCESDASMLEAGASGNQSTSCSTEAVQAAHSTTMSASKPKRGSAPTQNCEEAFQSETTVGHEETVGHSETVGREETVGHRETVGHEKTVGMKRP